MYPALLVFATLALVLGEDASASAVRQAIEKGFVAVGNLKTMRPGAVYSAEIDGMVEKGVRERFLRRRSAEEIKASQLSCGCGDNAFVFLEAIERTGLEALIVDAAEISSASLSTHFSGHAVVAVRDEGSQEDASWHLVDSTNLKVISEKWSRKDKKFEAFGRQFWIGFSGPAADYPVHSPSELKEFYAKTLAEVPRSVLEAELIRLKFTIDESLVQPDGALINPRVEKFIELQEDIFQKHDVKPTRTASVLLKLGEDDARTSFDFSETEGWVAYVGTKSGCTVSLLDYMEGIVRRGLRNGISPP